jgi:hypothetical protein
MRVSRRRYLARRLVALAALILVVGAVVSLADALVGDDDTETAAETAPAGTDTPGGTAASDGVVATSGAGSADRGGSALAGPATEASTEVAPTAAPSTTSGEPTTPSAATPARVLIAGDSDAGTFGPYLVTLLDQTGIVDSELDYKVSSGLSRPDFFDWPEHFRQQIPVKDPDIVVVTFGGNDAQGLSNIGGTFIVGQPSGVVGEGDTGGVSDAEWRAEYGRRVGEVMDFLSAEGRTLVWVGIPNDDDPAFTARLAVQNEVVKAELAERPHVVFIDTWSRFSGRDGNWAEYVIDPRDGQGKDVRSDVDGFHLNENGAEILALDIAEAVKAELRARGAVV